MHQCHRMCCCFSSPKNFSNAETIVGLQVLNYSGNLLFCQLTWYFHKFLHKQVYKPLPPIISFLPLPITTPSNESPCFLCLQNVNPWQAISIPPAFHSVDSPLLMDNMGHWINQNNWGVWQWHQGDTVWTA